MSPPAAGRGGGTAVVAAGVAAPAGDTACVRGSEVARDTNIMSAAIRVFMDSGIGTIRHRLSQQKAKQFAIIIDLTSASSSPTH
jgi:hypothetical protein